ncbi:hypothetical protein CSA37_01485 [Candidatus Fermentibacteria bacterium]|nr:MAG: hypothetical protein CSA37_01485 [Candidatus Fermentibacteria bacterium]
MRKSNIFETVTTRGALLPTDFLTKLSLTPSEVSSTRPEDFNHPGEKLNEVISRAWNTLQIHWKHFSEQEDKTIAITRERWLIPLFRELDYGNLKRAEKHTIDGKDYPVSHTRDNVPIHLLGTNINLDHRTPGKTRQIPHSMMQEYLNKNETPTWGILSNGQKLRILRENSSMTRQAYIEFDLEKMMESQAYSDFTLLYLICHESRFTKQTEEKKQIIEQWAATARKSGIRALDTLRTGVKEAIEALGKGFLINQIIRNNLRDREDYKQDYYRQLLRVAYRLIFLLTAESRELLLDPEATQQAKDLYYKYYSLTRIRNLAERKRGTRHKDLWKALNVTIASLCKAEPTPEIGIKPLGSFLWSAEATRDLNEADIENKYLCQALRAITLTTKEGVTTRVDYRNLGSEELGSIYESLLEMRPEVNADARFFKLNITAGNERKTTGSYYTPTELINELLNSALDPVIKTKKTEDEILNTKVCDPACGSGHFLIAAAHRMARHLAAKRTEETEPDPTTYRTALRDIISHCIYGVDINPMSVELCKISLWLEAIEPGKPLSFLDHHIKCGNSLMGTSPDLMIDHEVSEKKHKFISIPDKAFSPITVDDKQIASKLKKLNKTQRKSTSRDFFYSMTDDDTQVKQLALQVAEIDHRQDNSINQLKEKEASYRTVTTSAIFNTEKTKADLWCAAFVQRKTSENEHPITTETLRSFKDNPKTLKEVQREETRRLAEKYQFFHWYIEFPEVFQRENKEQNGFDVVLGNPPWEHTELKEKEFFASRDEKIANATGAQRKKLIASLEQSDPDLFSLFNETKREHDAPSHFVRNSEKYPLCGLGRINTYAVFAELNKDLINATGRVGCIVPSGIATDENTKTYISFLFQHNMLVSFYDMQNTSDIFNGVSTLLRFALLTLASGIKKPATIAYSTTSANILNNSISIYSMDYNELILFNPNTHTCPMFSDRKDYHISKKIYQKHNVLYDNSKMGNRESILFKQGYFNMTSDSQHFKDSSYFNSMQCVAVNNKYLAKENFFVPLYEGKMVNIYNYRYSDWSRISGSRQKRLPETPLEALRDSEHYTVPYYWVSEKVLRERQATTYWDRKWSVGWRDICRSTDERTAIFTLWPNEAAGHTFPQIFFLERTPQEIACFLANASTYIFDYLVRQKITGIHLTYNILKQIPIVAKEIYYQSLIYNNYKYCCMDLILERVLRLVYNTYELKSFAEDCGYYGSPFQYDEKQRIDDMAFLDAAFFQLHDISREEVVFIMAKFPARRRKEQKRYGRYLSLECILEQYSRIRKEI